MKVPLLVLLLLFSNGLLGQSLNVDSLTKVLGAMKNDTAKVNLLITLGDRLQKINRFSDSKAELEKAIDLAGQVNYPRGKERAMSTLANLAPPHLSTGERIQLHLNRLKVCAELNDPKCTAMSEQMLGLRYFSIGDYPRSLEHYQQAIRLNEQLKDTLNLAGVHYNLCTLFGRIDSSNQAKAHISEFIRLQQLRKDSIGLVAGMSSLASIHALRKEYDRALELHRVVLRFHQSRKDTSQLVFVLGNILSALRGLGRLEEASTVAQDLNRMYAAKPNQHPMTMAMVLPQLAELQLEMNNLKDAESTLKKALELATLVNSKRIMRDCHRLLTDLAEKKGDPRAALHHFKLFAAYKDSLMNEETSQQLSNLRVSYDVEKKDAEIGMLNLENEKKQAETHAERSKRLLTLGIAGAVVVLLLGGGFLINRNRKAIHREELARKELQTQLVQTDLERVRLTPHFIKNALTNVEELLSLGSTTEAERYTECFNRLMSMVLQSSRYQYVSLEEELDMMRHYLSLEADRIGMKLNWSVLVADDLQPSEVELPPMILQPLLENALKYADTQSGQGQLKLDVRKENDRIICCIEDNGPGINSTGAEKSGSNGLRITRERLQLFSQLRHSDARLDLHNTGHGTRAIVSFSVSS